MSDFLGDGSSVNTTNKKVNFQWDTESSNGHNRGLGRTYYPNGYLNSRDDINAETAFYPASGYKAGSTTGLENVCVYLWTVTPVGVGSGYHIDCPAGIAGINATSHGRAFGFPARCVKE